MITKKISLNKFKEIDPWNLFAPFVIFLFSISLASGFLFSTKFLHDYTFIILIIGIISLLRMAYSLKRMSSKAWKMLCYTGLLVVIIMTAIVMY